MGRELDKKARAICWAKPGYRSKNRSDGSVIGGIVGAMLQSIAIGAAYLVLCDFRSPDEWAAFGGMTIFLLAMAIALGSIAGVLVGAGIRLAQTRRRSTLGQVLPEQMNSS